MAYLLLQNKTMQMMYEIIYKALKEVGLEDQYEPQDYLNFFCLGNREAPDLSNPSSGGPAAVNAPNVIIIYLIHLNQTRVYMLTYFFHEQVSPLHRFFTWYIFNLLDLSILLRLGFLSPGFCCSTA